MEKLLLRPAEAADVLAISRAKVYELMACGALPVCRLGGVLRIPLGELTELVRAHACRADVTGAPNQGTEEVADVDRRID
jgi:excisionase family DNA binding protein